MGCDTQAGSATPINWLPSAWPPELSDTEVHVWAHPLDVGPERRATLAAFLTLDERRRASQYRTDVLSARFTVGRAVLRQILGQYLCLAPGDLRFAYDEHRKPTLAPDTLGGALHFNVTHAGGLALYAVSRPRPVGVDVEEIVPFPDMQSVAKSVFSSTELQALSGAAPADLCDNFFSTWTRKEAYLKARGTGLLAPLDRFDVSVGRRTPAALLSVAGDPRAPSRWSVVHLEPADGFVGALAVECPGVRVVSRRWCPEE
ncbi:MAG: 4'-phosphopantetheinyl transferase family protein [Gemmatimonadaceae bacterium]